MSLAYKKYHEYDFNEVKAKETKKTRVKGKTKIAPRLCIALVLIGALFISILFRYAAISEMKYQIYAHNQTIKEMQIEIEKCKIELEGMNKTSIIESKAVNELGMRVPDRQQIVYLDSNQETNKVARVSIAVPDSEQGENGFFRQVYSSLLNFRFVRD